MRVTRLVCRVFAVLALFLTPALAPAPALAAPPDFDLPSGGHFYSQGGNGVDLGYTVTDAGGVAFWAFYAKLGGPESLGYPISQRFLLAGRTTQIFQRGALQSPGMYDEPGSKAVRVMPALDLLSELGRDEWLEVERSVPRKVDPIAIGLNADSTLEQQITARQNLVMERPALRSVYFSADDPVVRWGLPTSRVTDLGNAYVIRTETAVLQEWKEETAWAHAGDVTVALVGNLIHESGIIDGDWVWEAKPSPEAPAPPPAPRNAGGVVAAGWQALPGERWIDVNLATQRVRAMVGNTVVYTAPATTGKRGWSTPTGTYRIFSRVFNETMDSATMGIPRSSPEGYYLTNIYFTQYFANGGYAIHSNYWQPDSAFGNYPTSHGCIGLRYNDAKFFWDFATYGTTVVVHY